MHPKKKIDLNLAYGTVCAAFNWDNYRKEFRLLPRENERYSVEIKYYEISTGMFIAPVQFVIFDSLQEAENMILIEKLSE